MACVYDTLEIGGVGILESPTGTGKTLSLLCPALSWLRRRELSILADELAPVEDADGWSDLLRAQAQLRAKYTWIRRRQCREERHIRARQSLAMTSDGTTKRQKQRRIDFYAQPSTHPEDESELSLEAPLQLEPAPEIRSAPATEAAFDGKLQIIFCSRTHSQLAQVVREIRRIPTDTVPENLAVVTLGSRQSLCINETLRNRGKGGHLNDLCRLATEKRNGLNCELKKSAEVMADAILSEMMDIEAMTERGRAPVGGGCPYYGNRRAVAEADMLLVPYPSLVNKETRQKLGIRTQGNVLIFDEAHNLLEAIGESNSVQMTLQQARAATEDLETYTKAYEVRLSAMNAVQLRQLRQLSMQLHRYLGALEAPAALTVGGFLVALGADHFDLPSLAAFVQRTELARKVRHFSEKVNLGKALASSSVYVLADLLTALEHSSAEDRIICEPGSQRGDAMLRYLSLDAEARFQEILVSARAVLFAGGTLEPRELRPLAAPKSLRCFQGRHVVPPDHVLARYVTHGPAGELLDFRKDKRCSASMVAELQQILTSAAAATCGGMVVFFPSYEYLSVVANSFASRSYWRADGCLLAGRPLFVETEPKQGAAQGPKDPPKTLQNFAHAVREEGAAILLAVSGGSLSEGIDFKDDLCRLVAVVGLPYPNASDLAMVEKMRFLDAKRKSRSDGGLSGRDFYSAKCMKAVNQCIGRSIRHARDWSAILLLDHRYAQPGIHQQISRWLREAATAVGFKDALAQLQNFFLKAETFGQKVQVSQ